LPIVDRLAEALFNIILNLIRRNNTRVRSRGGESSLSSIRRRIDDIENADDRRRFISRLAIDERQTLNGTIDESRLDDLFSIFREYLGASHNSGISRAESRLQGLLNGALQQINDITPVDTGRLRDNNRLGIGYISPSFVKGSITMDRVITDSGREIILYYQNTLEYASPNIDNRRLDSILDEIVVVFKYAYWDSYLGEIY